MVVGWRYSLEWASPYSSPPDGQPRVLMEYFETSERRQQRIAAGEGNIPEPILKAHRPGAGYMICVSTISPPQRLKSKEQLAQIRLKRLQARMTQKHPLFAEQFIAEELQKRGWYYNGEEDPRYAQGRAEVLHREEEMYRRFYDFVMEHEGAEAAENVRRAASWLFDGGVGSDEESELNSTRERFPAGGAGAGRAAGVEGVSHVE